MTASRERRVFTFGEFRLDPAERELTGPAGSVQLTRRLSDALIFMVERPGRLLEKRLLLDAIWPDVIVDENSLAQAISALRRVLGERAGDARYISTVPGLGYRFLPDVEITTEAPAAAEQRTPSIAVLPFDDLSAGRDQDYFAEGIADEILHQLARIDGLRVIGRTSSFLFRGRRERPEVIARRLGADHLLVGSVRKNLRRLRVTAQLIDGATGLQLWSEQFDRELEDVFALQEDIARAAANACSAALGIEDVCTADRGTADVDAYDAYLRARAMSHQTGAPAMLRSAELYREALRIDPRFVLAWVGLAEACRGILIFAPERAEHAPAELTEAVSHALTLAPHAAVGHVARAWRCLLERDWPGAQSALETARRIDPRESRGADFYRAVLLNSVGRVAAGAEQLRVTARNDPLSLLLSSLLQLQLHMAGLEDAAESEYRRSLDLPGNRDIAEHTALHRAWTRGDSAAAVRAQFRRYLDHQTVPMPVLHEIFDVHDDPEAALSLLERAVAAPEYRTATRQWILASWLARYGDTDGALAALRRSHVELIGAQASWLWLPALAPVRRTPGFGNIVRQIGLVDYWRATGNWGDFARPLEDDAFECY